MDEATFRIVHEANVNPPSWEELYEAKAEKYRALEKRMEALELVASYAKDVVDFWPSMAMRTIRIMIPKMDALKEALSLAK
jgi:hypothetical protein